MAGKKKSQKKTLGFIEKMLSRNRAKDLDKKMDMLTNFDESDRVIPNGEVLTN